MKRIKKYNQDGFDHVFLSVAFIVLFGIVGAFYYVYLHAAVNGFAITGPGGKCLTTQSDKATSNSAVKLVTCNDLASQKWTVDATKQQVVSSNGLCLSAADRNVGRPALVRTCTDFPITKATYDATKHLVVNVASKLCLTDQGGATTENNPIIMQACNNSASQSWTYSTDTTTPPPVGGGGSGTSPYIAYTTNSFFRSALGSSWPIDTTSATGIAWHKSHEPQAFPKINGVDGSIWGIAFGLGTCSDPIWKFSSAASVPASSAFLKTEGFHAPANWTDKFPQNSDAPIEVIDTCGVASRPKGFSVWGANVFYDGNASRILTTNPASNSGSIVGGSFAHDSNGLDARAPGHGNDTRNQTSRGNIPDSFAIRDDLLKFGMTGGNGGTLGHVLQMFSMETDSSQGFVAPMAGAEGGQAGYGAEGERIAIKPSWNPPSTCTGAPLVVARTLQKYGAYLGNNAGGGSGFKAQQGSTLLHTNDLGKCFTWDNMAYVQRGWSASW
jgi:hypothetical protein